MGFGMMHLPPDEEEDFGSSLPADLIYLEDCVVSVLSNELFGIWEQHQKSENEDDFSMARSYNPEKDEYDHGRHGLKQQAPKSIGGMVPPTQHQKLLNGLSHVPVSKLERCLKPIYDSLSSLDAESVLDLRPCHEGGGAPIGDGFQVYPIHTEVVPTPRDRSAVRYLHLAEREGQYSMGIFIFPPFSRIPLHDHPGMCVVSRVLYGEVQRLSLDMAREQPKDVNEYEEQGKFGNEQEQQNKDMMHLEGGAAKQQQDSSTGGWLFRKAMAYATSKKKTLPDGTKLAFMPESGHHHVERLEAPACAVLYPFEGNLHEFVAGPQGAAVIDVLLPPYDHSVGEEEPRDCTFYALRDCSEAVHEQVQRMRAQKVHQAMMADANVVESSCSSTAPMTMTTTGAASSTPEATPKSFPGEYSSAASVLHQQNQSRAAEMYSPESHHPKAGGFSYTADDFDDEDDEYSYEDDDGYYNDNAAAYDDNNYNAGYRQQAQPPQDPYYDDPYNSPTSRGFTQRYDNDFDCCSDLSNGSLSMMDQQSSSAESSKQLLNRFAARRCEDDVDDHRTPCWVVPTGDPEDYHCVAGTYAGLCADS